MKLERTVWGMLGSVFVNVALALAVGAAYSVAPPFQVAQAAEVADRGNAPVHVPASPGAGTVPGDGRGGSGYLTFARMGWGIG